MKYIIGVFFFVYCNVFFTLPLDATMILMNTCIEQPSALWIFWLSFCVSFTWCKMFYFVILGAYCMTMQMTLLPY